MPPSYSSEPRSPVRSTVLKGTPGLHTLPPPHQKIAAFSAIPDEMRNEYSGRAIISFILRKILYFAGLESHPVGKSGIFDFVFTEGKHFFQNINSGKALCRHQ